MAFSIIYYIPPTPSQANHNSTKLQHNIRQKFRFETLPRWTLEHRIYREAGSTGTSSQSTNASDSQGSNTGPSLKYMQLLFLSWSRGRMWIGNTEGSQTGGHSELSFQSMSETTLSASQTSATTTKDSQSSKGASVKTQNASDLQKWKSSPETSLWWTPSSDSADFTTFINVHLAPMWSARGMVYIRDGTAVKIGNFLVRFGDLHTSNNAGAAGRGTFVQLACVGDEFEDGMAVLLLQDIWKQIGNGFSNVRVFGGQPRAHNKKKDLQEEVALWMEALRLKDSRL